MPELLNLIQENLRLKRMNKEIQINMPVYNKLVRDRIPQIIEASGKVAIARVLEPSEHLGEIKAKMLEEAQELQEATSPNEAVNILRNSSLKFEQTYVFATKSYQFFI